MTEEEMCQWVRDVVTNRIPESTTLDYKELLLHAGQRARKELAKDASSFANTQGGTLLYGISETVEDGVPVPTGLSGAGIDPDPDLAKRVEDVLLGMVQPVLPELLVRALRLREIQPRIILLVHHPESWDKPHMVEGYEEARYYRRGSFQAVKMREREVEAAYAARAAAGSHAQRFFESHNFVLETVDVPFLRVVMCPRYPLIRRDEMSEERFRHWLDTNPPGDRRGTWVPFLDGWRFLGFPEGGVSGKQYELRLFHNGALLFRHDLTAETQHGKLDVSEIERILERMVLPYAITAFGELRISGPVHVQVGFSCYRGVTLDVAHPWHHASVPVRDSSFTYLEETSVNELTMNEAAARDRLLVRFASAFGVYREPVVVRQ